MTELCPECSQTLEVAFVELHTRVETTGCVTCAEALARFVRAAAAVEVDESVEFGTVPVSGMVPVSGLAAWKYAEEQRHLSELADRGLEAPLNDGAYGPEAIMLGIGEGVPIGVKFVRDPYLGDSIANIMKKEVQLRSHVRTYVGREEMLNKDARREIANSRYDAMIQSDH